MSYGQTHLGYNTAASVIAAVVIINEAGFEVSCYGQRRVLINLKARSKARGLFLWLRDVCGYRCEASAPVGHITGQREGDPWLLQVVFKRQEPGGVRLDLYVFFLRGCLWEDRGASIWQKSPGKMWGKQYFKFYAEDPFERVRLLSGLEKHTRRRRKRATLKW